MGAIDVRIGRRGLGKVRRVVVRLAPATIARVDALRSRWPGARRSAVLRALILRGLDVEEAYAPAARVPCHHPVLDKQKRASMCPAAGTTVRQLDGCPVLTYCGPHAAEIDAKQALDTKGGA